MSGMFSGGKSTFDGDISAWDVSGVTDMSAMFSGADSFNGDLSAWDVSSVTDMNSMFRNADAFNQDLSGWCVPNITSAPTNFGNADTDPVWGTCPLFYIGANGITVVCTSTSVGDTRSHKWGYLHQTYEGANNRGKCSHHLYQWHYGYVSTVLPSPYLQWGSFVVGCEQRNGYGIYVLPSQCLQWGYLGVGCEQRNGYGIYVLPSQRLQWRYLGVGCEQRNGYECCVPVLCDAFNGDLSAWDVSSVTTMRSMFYQASTFNQDLSSWCVSITSAPISFENAGTNPVWGTCQTTSNQLDENP